METGLQRQHLLGIAELSPAEIAHVLDTAETFREINAREIKKVPTLRGRTLVNLFFEPSTRTRTSFEIAGKRLSADTINISASTSSVTKGETLLDTARNLEAMAPDFIVIRHPSAGAPHALARICRAAVVNAGDGAHEHPTQALLDALTIRQRKGRIEGLEVAILGDVLHSRVARSNTHLLTKLGARVRLAGPGTLAPPEFVSLVENGEVSIANRVEEAVEGADVVVVLRIQRERQSSAFLPSLREYAVHYGLNLKRLSAAKADAIVMHPGPMNRGIEIASDVADGTRSLILDQVANGLAVRMAVLYLLAGGTLLAQPADERAKPEQQTPSDGVAVENPAGAPAHAIRQTTQTRDAATQPALSRTDHGAQRDDHTQSTPEAQPEAQSALEFETVVTNGKERSPHRSRPNRPKLPAAPANAHQSPDHEQLTTDN